MNSSDVVGYVEDGAVYCTDCVGTEGEKHDAIFANPVFADSEWDSFPVCDTCGEKITEVTLTLDGIKYELEQIHFEWFQIVESDTESGDAFHDEDGDYYGDGWYGWYCMPGCIPDSEPYGPYDTEVQLIDDRSADLW